MSFNVPVATLWAAAIVWQLSPDTTVYVLPDKQVTFDEVVAKPGKVTFVTGVWTSVGYSTPQA